MYRLYIYIVYIYYIYIVIHSDIYGNIYMSDPKSEN